MGLLLFSAAAIAGSFQTVIAQESKDLLWSLMPVSHPAVPEGDPAMTNPINRFLEAERVANGINAVGPADKLTLLRRVHMDLAGKGCLRCRGLGGGVAG